MPGMTATGGHSFKVEKGSRAKPSSANKTERCKTNKTTVFSLLDSKMPCVNQRFFLSIKTKLKAGFQQI